jgi:hypothetical protein
MVAEPFQNLMEPKPAARILYFNHEHARPAGGVRAIYTHVLLLNRNGLPAFVIHRTPGFKPTWFTEPLPTLYSDQGLQLNGSDILVIPEDLPILPSLKSTPVRKIIFCQNHFYAFRVLPPGETWRTLGITHVLCSSEIIADFVQKTLGWSEAPVVHCAIDQDLFKPAEKKLQIAYMPRKAPLAASFIRGVFETLDPNASKVKWIELENMPPDRVAAALSESAIFLSLSHLEGLGLPPLEAMASGCAVTGFHGHGGLEYARPDNGFWSEEGNLHAAVQTLRNLVAMILASDPKVKQTIENGQKVAATYTPHRQERELVQYMKRILSGA